LLLLLLLLLRQRNEIGTGARRATSEGVGGRASSVRCVYLLGAYQRPFVRCSRFRTHRVPL